MPRGPFWIETKVQNGVRTVEDKDGAAIDEIRVEVVSRKPSTGSTKGGAGHHDEADGHQRLQHTLSERDRHAETRGSYKRPHGESIHHHPHHCQSMKGHSHDHHHGDSIHGHHGHHGGSQRHQGHRHFESKRLHEKGDVMSDKPVSDDYLANRPPQQLQDKACAAICPNCRYKVWTKITFENGCLVWTLVVVLTLIACVPCALYLLFMEGIKDVVHICPKCEQTIGVFKRKCAAPELRTLG